MPNEFKTYEQKVALHESAHAFIAWQLGAVINIVTIIGPTSPGEQKIEERTPFYVSMSWNEARSRRLDQRAILTSIAPAFAEEIFLGRISSGSLFNIQEAMDDLLWPDDRSIVGLIKAARAVRKRSTNKKHQANAFFRSQRDDVRMLFNDPRAKKALLALADALVDRKILSGQETASILEDAYGGLPERALPRDRHHRSAPKTIEERARRAAELLWTARAFFDEDEDGPGVDRFLGELDKLRGFLLILAADSLPASRSGSDGGKNPET